LVRGVNAPLPPEAKKISKFDYEMVHSEVYLNKYVVSISMTIIISHQSYRSYHFTPTLHSENCSFCMFSLFSFSSIFPSCCAPRLAGTDRRTDRLMPSPRRRHSNDVQLTTLTPSAIESRDKLEETTNFSFLFYAQITTDK